MDWLKSEIDSKKRQLDSIPSDNSSKYLKRSDLDKARQQARQATLQQSNDKYKQSSSTSAPVASTTTAAGTPSAGVDGQPTARSSTTPSGLATTGKHGTSKQSSNTTVSSNEGFNVSNEEAIRRLRHKNQPIRLFGESDNERRLRLRALELIEERSEGQRNDFMKALENAEKGANSSSATATTATSEKQLTAAIKDSAKAALKANKDEKAGADSDNGSPSTLKKSSKEPNPKDEEVIVDVSLVKTNPHKVYPQIYHALKVSIPVHSRLGRSRLTHAYLPSAYSRNGNSR